MSNDQTPRNEWLDGVNDRISKAMESNGLSQRELGHKLGISGSAVAQWGLRDASFTHWWRLACLADALGVSVDWLLGRPGAPKPALGVDPRLVRRLTRQVEELVKSTDMMKASLHLPPPRNSNREE
jgi:transcriptional regulator with XRE-family HTH domain